MMFRKKSIAIIMAVVMIISCVNFMMFTSLSATVINVETANDLISLNSNINSATAPVTVNFIKDIDASGINFTPVNTTKRVIVNGNNHYINNLRSNNYGLFAKVGASSSISNLGLTNAYVTNFSATSTGYGLLLGIAGNNTTITGCFVHGSLAVYSADGYTAEAVGGLVGYFNGVMNNCFSVVDIHTDATMVGGLIGYYYSKTNNAQVSISYSTGTIDNQGREYIGGIVGKADCSCLHQCYTTVQIKNPYTDYVRSIGVVPSLDSYVFYDENVCYQRQDENDTAHRFNGSYQRFPSADLWTYSSGYYPQIAYFYNNSNKVFKNISAISAAVVHLNDVEFGREYVPLTSKTVYKTASVTNNTGTSNNLIQWHIVGGVDEYYYPGQSYSISEGKIDGLSGSAYDSTNGKYIFTTSADVVFTAVSGEFERDITVHVTSSTTHPYSFSGGGAGTSSSPYLIKTPDDLDMIRLHSINDANGELYYKINTSTALDLSSDTDTADWYPILGFRGHILGNKKDITNVKVSKTTALTGDAGFFGTISGNTTIDALYIAGADIIPEGGCSNAGILAGTANNAVISNSTISGYIEGAVCAGGLFGTATDSDVTACIVTGAAISTDYAGGLIGIAETSDVTVTDTLTAVTCMDAEVMAGMIAQSNGASITTSLSNSILYTATENTKAGLYNGTANISYSYFYDTGAMIYDDPNGKTREELMAKDAKDTLFNDHGSSMWVRSSTTASNSICPIPDLNKTSMKYLADNLVYYTADFGTPSLYNFKKCSLQGGYLTTKSMDGYSVYGGTDNNYSVSCDWDVTNYLSSYDNLNGGKELFVIKKRGTSQLDVRYLIFDVKTFHVNYKVMLGDAANNDYLTDMTETLLADFTDGAGASYGFILPTTAADLNVDKSLPIKLVAVQDSLKLELCLPSAKYSYIVFAYADKARTRALTEISPNTFDINGTADPNTGRYSLYFDIMISENSLPWGIYNIDR